MVKDLVTERLSVAPGNANNSHAWARSGSLPFTWFFTGNEVWAQMEELLKTSMVRDIGISDFSIKK